MTCSIGRPSVCWMSLAPDYIEYRDTNRDRDGWVKQSDLYATFLGEMEVRSRPPTRANTSQTTSRSAQSAEHGSNDLDAR